MNYHRETPHRNGKRRMSLVQRNPQFLPIPSPLAPILTPLLGGGRTTVTATQTQTVVQPGPSPPSGAGGGSVGSPSPQAGAGGGGASPPPPQGGLPPPQGLPPQGQPAAGGATTPPADGSPIPAPADGPPTPAPADGSPSPAPADGTTDPTSFNASPDGVGGAQGDPSAPAPARQGGGGAPGPASGVSGGQQGTSQGASGPTITSGSTPGEDPSSQPHKMASGAMAAIVITVLILSIFIVIVLLRRRAAAKRENRQQRWWFIGARSESPDSQTSAEQRARVLSMRSSFGTNIDHGFDFSEFTDLPQIPTLVMVQRPQDHALVNPSTSPPGAVAIPPAAHVNEGTSRRNSTGSIRSNDIQYLAIPPIPNDPFEPMSVRPFSPSESFAFPQPPSDSGPPSPAHTFSPESAYVIYATRRLSTARSSRSASTRRGTRYPAPPATPHDPFGDPQAEIVDGTVSDTPSRRYSPQFVDIETIHRPFLSTLGDELSVSPGDAVRVIQSFNDGWAFVEQLQVNGKGAHGLIPIDCLRENGQELPAFLAAKRVSSYVKPGHNGVLFGSSIGAAV